MDKFHILKRLISNFNSRPVKKIISHKYKIYWGKVFCVICFFKTVFVFVGIKWIKRHNSWFIDLALYKFLSSYKTVLFTNLSYLLIVCFVLHSLNSFPCIFQIFWTFGFNISDLSPRNGLKGAVVYVISSDSPFIGWHVRLTTLPLKTNQQCKRYPYAFFRMD